MVAELPRIQRVSAAPKLPNTLVIIWAGIAKVVNRVDMTGVIASVEAFEPLRDPNLFRQVHVIDHGIAVGWPNGLDYAAANLRVLADEQLTMDGAGFVLWQRRLKLSNQEAADALGVSLKTVKNYRKTNEVPTAVTLACRAMLRDPIVMQAHYRPRTTGRPAKAPAPAKIKVTNATNDPSAKVGSLLRPTTRLPPDGSGSSLNHTVKAPRNKAGRFLSGRTKKSGGRESA